jgi:hypothetical protein
MILLSYRPLTEAGGPGQATRDARPPA